MAEIAVLADKDVSINWSTILQSPQGEETLKSLLDSVGVSGLSSAEEEKLLSDYVLCMQKISGNDVSQPLQLTQVLSILKDWAPNQDMICLFVRWAKKNPQHFNTSSIATLRCLAKQTKVKSPLFFSTRRRPISSVIAKAMHDRVVLVFVFYSSRDFRQRKMIHCI